MALDIKNSKAKVDEIVRNVQDYSVLIDDVRPDGKVDGLSCKPGLGMHTEAKSLRGLSNDLESGLFKLLVMGKFKNGKSTFINALLGKMMMAAKTTATTAVIAMVEFGTRENQVRVYENDMKNHRTISLDQFTAEFALTEKDQEIIEGGGNIDRFAHIDHVVMESGADMFKDGVRLIDSPGLEEAHSRTKTTTEFVPKANAIIFTLTATALFSAAERKYINENFAGKGLRNVFFIVNRIDNLNSPDALERDVKPAMRKQLESVFTDEHGRFDESLYNNRVFYTNAYGALCIRTGQPYTVLVGKNPVKVNLDIADTGMVEFEQSLTEFLNSDERLHATFQSTMTSMANLYQSAEKKIEVEKKARSLPLAELEKNAIAARAKLDDLKKDADDMKKMIRRSGSTISAKIYNSMLSFAQSDVPRAFDAVVENEKVDFGVGGMLKMAGAMITSFLPGRDNTQQMSSILQPITDKINEYIKDQLRDWQESVPTLIDPDMKDMEAEIGDSVERFDLGLDEAVDMFATGNVKSPVSGKKGTSALQTILALSNWDVSLAVEGMASGGMKWGDFMKRAILQIGLDVAVTMVLGAPFLIPALIVEIVSLAIRGKQMGKKLLKQIGPVAFEQLRKRIVEEESDMKVKIETAFIQKSDEISATAIQLIKDKEAELNKILSDKRNTEKDSEKEGKRQDTVLLAMRKRFDNVYSALYSRTAADADLAKFAKA